MNSPIKELRMTTSELAVTLTIWGLTIAGGFFGLRAKWRHKKQRVLKDNHK